MKVNSLPTEMLILAGGFGTRLKSVVSDVPKPMAPVAGRPFLAYILDYWIAQGIKRFVISTGHLADVIKSHFGGAYKNASITYVHEQSPLGTGGALRMGLNSVNWSNQLALTANGDTWFPVSLQQLFADASQQGAQITIALKRLEKNDRYGAVELTSEGRVTAFGLKTTGSSFINAGIYLLNVEEIKNALSGLPEVFSLESDFLMPFAASGLVGSSIQEKPFLDIGVPDDYKRVLEYLQ